MRDLLCCKWMKIWSGPRGRAGWCHPLNLDLQRKQQLQRCSLTRVHVKLPDALMQHTHSIVGQNKCIFPNYNTDSQPQETRHALLDSLRSLWLHYTEVKPRAASDTRILKHACSVSTGRSERLWNLICTESHEHEERCTAAENTDWCIDKRFIIALRFHKLER